jgi:lipid A ethanolaminephosphotransferase
MTLFQQFFKAYPPSATHILYLLSLGLLIAALIEIFLHLLCFWKATRPVLILIVVVSALASYFMDTYHTVIDTTMLQNVLETNTREAGSLFSFKLVLYVLFLGVLPAFFIYKTRITYKSLPREIFSSSKIVLIAIVVIAAQAFMFGSFYSSFFREHKEVRVYANPIMYMYSSYRYASAVLDNGEHFLAELGTDAEIPDTDAERELVIIVVGETARADKFSLNGYPRKTNPLLEKEQVYSFKNVESCGTSTAISVPCMFSHLEGNDFTVDKGKEEENLLDVLQHAGANILWRDNNSDSKNVALRVAYEDFKSKQRNPACDDECRDIGMLHGLQDYIDSKNQGDIVIVLHQMGNHGPDYYKRYPKEFEKFTPVCQTNLLEECTSEEITNTYDNAILYTDYFLSETIQLLKENTNRFETAMVYISDHGESLGENGIYLHGMPNFMAPDNQRKVGAILWFGDSYNDIDKVALASKTDTHYSHDHLFHTILGLLEVKSSVYDESFDIVDHIEEPEVMTASNTDPTPEI